MRVAFEKFATSLMATGVVFIIGLLTGCSDGENNPKGGSTTIDVIEPSPTWVDALLVPSEKTSKLDTIAKTVSIHYPLDEAMFPPEMIAPTFTWTDSNKQINRWVVGFAIGTNTHSFPVLNPTWRPNSETWTTMKTNSVKEPLSVKIIGYNSVDKAAPLSQSFVRISTSEDQVDASIFYREVILPFIDAVIDPSKLRWRYGSVDMEEQPPVVLDNLPVCGNCHSFSQDGSLLAMDVDYANSKGSYVITRTRENMQLTTSDIITWNDYKKSDGELTFGLLSQISPDGRYVLSTVKDKSVFVPMPGLEYSQLFFPIKGIVALYDRENEKFSALEGAADPKYCQSNPTWSPDGETILFARAEAYDLKNTMGEGKTLLTREECKEFVEDGKPFLFKIYQVPFNEGKGGTAVPLEGASDEGISSYFPKYSPDGRWIVFCKSSSYMLLRGDSKLYIMPASGGTPRLMRCNTPKMNSWHSWSPNGKWLVFSSKANGPYTQLWLTHIDVNGESTPPVVLSQFTSPDRAANIPEFVNLKPDGIKKIVADFLDDISMCRAGDEYYRNSKSDEAITKYLEALTINPNCYQAHQKLGFLYFNVKGKHDEGLEHMAKAIQLEPRYAFSQYDYGMANLSMKKFDLAVKHIKEAIRLVPRGVDLQYDAGEMRFQLGRAYLFSDNVPAAIATLKDAVAIRPKQADARYLLAALLVGMREVPEGYAQLQLAAETNPAVDRNPDIHANIAQYYAVETQYDIALREAERALELAQKTPGKEDLISQMQQVIPQLREMAR